MADYYPLLARALDALPNSSPAMRKAVYDRARNALTAQLRSLDPPVAEADIGVELTALDSAIKRLEGEFGATPPEPVAAPPPPKPAPPAPEPAPPAAETAPLPEPTPMPVAVPLSTQPVAETAPEPASPPPVETVRPTEAAPPAPDAKLDQKAKTEFVAFVPPPRKKSASSVTAAAEREAPAVPEASNTNASGDVSLPPSIDNGAARRPKIDVVAPRPSKSRALRNVFVGGMLALVIGAIAVAAFLLRDEPSNLSQDADGDGQAQVDPAEQKFADRVDGSRGESGRVPNSVAPPPEVTVAQRGILYEENASNPQAEPRTTAGRVVWRLEPVNGEQGQPLQNAVRMTAEFSEIGVQLKMTLRKNLDVTLPASHTIELDFTMSGPSASQVVQDIGLLQLKDDQNARGSTISGLPVRVRDNLFLIGMSNLPSDMDRNRELLLNKAWIDLGFKFRSGQRGVIAVEKGASGSQALRAAFDLWRD